MSRELKVSWTKPRDKTRELIWCLPGEWAFIMMPPGLTIGFILSLLLVATMLPEEVKVTQEEGQRERSAASPQTYIPRGSCPSLQLSPS